MDYQPHMPTVQALLTSPPTPSEHLQAALVAIEQAEASSVWPSFVQRSSRVLLVFSSSLPQLS